MRSILRECNLCSENRYSSAFAAVIGNVSSTVAIQQYNNSQQPLQCLEGVVTIPYKKNQIFISLLPVAMHLCEHDVRPGGSSAVINSKFIHQVRIDAKVIAPVQIINYYTIKIPASPETDGAPPGVCHPPTTTVGRRAKDSCSMPVFYGTFQAIDFRLSNFYLSQHLACCTMQRIHASSLFCAVALLVAAGVPAINAYTDPNNCAYTLFQTSSYRSSRLCG